MTINIPTPAASRKGMNGQSANNYVYLSNEVTPEGKPVLKVHTGKSGRAITTSYSFGHHKNENGMDCFSCMIMSDYSKNLRHDAKRATAKSITDAHAEAMKPENLLPHIEAAAAQHNITL